MATPFGKKYMYYKKMSDTAKLPKAAPVDKKAPTKDAKNEKENAFDMVCNSE